MNHFFAALRHPTRSFYGWRMLAVICFTGALNNAFFSKGAALFLIPVESTLGLNRATSSLIFSLARSEGAVEGPFIGYLVDRYGSRKMLMLGTVIAGAGFIIFALATNVWIFALAYLVFISFGATTAFQHAASAAVNQWFSRYRVRAIAVNEASGNLGSTLLVPVIGLVIALWGWQAAALMAAAAYLGVILPLSPMIKDSPEKMGLLPDGASPEEVAAARRSAGGSASAKRILNYYDRVDFTVRETLRTSSYWFLLIGTMFRQVSKAAIQVHFVAIMVWKGLDVATAGLLFALLLGMNVPAKLFFGYMGDRLSKPAVLSVGMVLNAVSLAMLWEFDAIWALAVSAVLGGLSEGITPINWGAIGDYFGRRHYATLRGIINLSHSWALVLMPFAAGWWFDHFASYSIPIFVSGLASVVSAGFYALMRRPRPPVRAGGSAPQLQPAQAAAATPAASGA